MTNKKNKVMKDGKRMENAISTLFLLYMGVIFPLIMHDKYFDITVTKYKTFQVGVCLYAILMVLAVVAELPAVKGYSVKKELLSAKDERGITSFIKKHNIMPVDVCMCAFFLANVCAFIVAEDKLSAYTGESGRRCGLLFMILAYLVYVCLGRGYKLPAIIPFTFLCTGSFSAVVALLQYAGIDFLKLRKGLTESQGRIYISTFGNIDIYASFLCVFVPVAMGIYLLSHNSKQNTEKGTSKKETASIKDKAKMFLDRALPVASFASICIGSSAMASTNADLAYAGIIVALAFLFVAALSLGSLHRFVDVMIAVCGGFLLAGIVGQRDGSSLEYLDGISAFVTRIKPMTMVLFMLVVIRVILLSLKKAVCRVKGKKAFVIGVLSVVAVGILTLWAGVHFEVIPVHMDDSWGNYRGYVWSRLLESYRGFSPVNKIIGYGNETVKAIMSGSYYEEMMDVVGVIYDNAHNEYIQYLVTTGLFGLLSYVFLIVCAIYSMVKCIRLSEDSANRGLYLGVMLGIIGYAAQAAFNLNQALTTPYLFVLIGLAAGISRNTCHKAL
ncbi:MAG: O-antigen ligase family protein [Coprococcus sp.]|nr:O-antigen ligase family protein [Coprococcus sp.]